VKDIHDVITHATFGDDRLRGSGVVAGQISAFPIDFAGRPYNSHTTVWACDNNLPSTTTDFTNFRKFDKSINNDYLVLYCELNFT